MQLLVFAHTPPPLHGQSLMVQTLVDGLPSVAPEIRLHHIDARLSRDPADIGRPRLGKILRLVVFCLRALRVRLTHGPMILYYIPAPAKRGALYRDWIVMALCRPFFPRLVLHWHAVGLGEWLATRATQPERWMTRRLLGGADLALALAPELVADAQILAPRRIAIVPNGLDVDGVTNSAEGGARVAWGVGERSNSSEIANARPSPLEVLFLGLCSRDKGVFDTLSAVAEANRRKPGDFRLTVAGGFADKQEEREFRALSDALGPAVVRHVGLVDAAQKAALFADADVFCFPTRYAHEGQPLVLIEALAHDVPIITTRWRAIPGMLPETRVWFVEPQRPDQLTAALLEVAGSRAAPGTLRAHYLAHFTRGHYLTAFFRALASLDAQEGNSRDR